jgi:hypothetical protein
MRVRCSRHWRDQWRCEQGLHLCPVASRAVRCFSIRFFYPHAGFCIFAAGNGRYGTISNLPATRQLTHNKVSALIFYRYVEERDMVQPPSSKIASIERVPARRNRVLLGGIVSYGHGKHSFNCTIRDITDTGARIAIAGQQFPANFYLINIRDRVVYDARVTWNSGSEVGVSFKNTLRLAEIVDPALGYLSELWYTQAPR